MLIEKKIREKFCSEFFPNCRICNCFSECFPNNGLNDQFSELALLEQMENNIMDKIEKKHNKTTSIPLFLVPRSK